MIKLFVNEIKEEFPRENFSRIEKYVREETFRKGKFKFMELTFPGAVTAVSMRHGLTFQPLDVITLSIRNPDSTSVTWHYDDFTRDFIVVTTDGPCTVRFFLGRYTES